MDTKQTALPKPFNSNIVPMAGLSAPRAVSRREAAEMLSVSQKTVERLIDRGEILGFRVGASWRIMISDLEAFVIKQQATERRRVG